MNASNAPSAEKALAQLGTLGEIYRELLQWVDRQLQAVSDQNDHEALFVLKEKQACMEKIQQLEKRLGQTVEQMSGTELETFQNRADASRSACEETLQKIMDRENQCAGLLKERKSDLSAQMKGFSRGRNMLKDLGKPDSGRSGFSKKV